MHEEKHALSDEEDHSDFFNDSDEDMEELADDEQEKLFLHMNTSSLEDVVDNGLETFVQKEGPNQIMNLILKEQTDNVVFGDIFEYQDYEDWIRCVVEDEKRKNEQFLDATSVQVSNVFELDAS